MSQCFGGGVPVTNIGKYILTDDDMADEGRSHSWLRTCFRMEEGASAMGVDLHRNLVSRLAVWIPLDSFGA